MRKLAESKLLAGYIFGDNRTKEYVYLPASEVDAAVPILVYEEEGQREDVSMEKALEIIEKRSLKPVAHPIMGKNSIG